MVFDMAEEGKDARPMCFASPEEVSGRLDSTLEALALRWFAMRSETGLPGRDDIDPMDFPRLLASTYLLDCLDDGDFMFRVAGSVFREMHGFEVTGMRVSEVLTCPQRTAPLWADMRACCADALPVYRQGWTIWRAPQPPLRFQRLMLPLGDRGDKTVRQILGSARMFDSTGGAWA